MSQTQRRNGLHRLGRFGSQSGGVVACEEVRRCWTGQVIARLLGVKESSGRAGIKFAGSALHACRHRMRCENGRLDARRLSESGTSSHNSDRKLGTHEASHQEV